MSAVGLLICSANLSTQATTTAVVTEPSKTDESNWPL
jgi:hypothetical protein